MVKHIQHGREFLGDEEVNQVHGRLRGSKKKRKNTTHPQKNGHG